MTLKFKNQLKGDRIVLKITKPTIQMGKLIFKLIQANREYLNKWFSWPKSISKLEDTLKYLFEQNLLTQKGVKVEYGIFIGDLYIGNIKIFDINEHKKSCELGYWLGELYTGKGYMTEAIKIIEKDIFERMNLNRIQIRCDERNTPSIKVGLKCGFVLEGKLREYQFSEYYKDFSNILVLSKLKSEYKKC